MAVLSNREKRFLENNGKMRKNFSAYTQQASIMYEYCREFDSERTLFERFRNVQLKIKNGALKMPNSRGRTTISVRQNEQFGTIKINAFSGEKLDNEFGGQQVPKNANYSRVRFFNSKQSKLSSRTFTPISPQNRVAKPTQNTKKIPQKSGLDIRFDTLFDTMCFHRTIYHEMAHSMNKRTVRELEHVLARRGKSAPAGDKNKVEKVVFSGVNPIYGYAVGKNGRSSGILWRNAGMMYLEEGVVENMAMDCVENELIWSDNPQLYGVDKIQFLGKMQDSVTYYSAYSLTGLWDSVSNHELTRQHLSGLIAESEQSEATEIFKTLFAEYVHSVVGNTYAPTTTGIFTTNKAEKIASTYGKCVDFCKKQYALTFSTNKHNESLRGFKEKLETATNIDNLIANLSNYIEMNATQKSELADKLSSALLIDIKKRDNKKTEQLEKDLAKQQEKENELQAQQEIMAHFIPTPKPEPNIEAFEPIFEGYTTREEERERTESNYAMTSTGRSMRR